MKAEATFTFKTENSAAAIAELNKIANADKKLKDQVEKKPKGGGLGGIFESERKVKSNIGGLVRELANVQTAGEAAAATIVRLSEATRVGAAAGIGAGIGFVLHQSLIKSSEELETFTRLQQEALSFNPKGASESSLVSQIKKISDAAEDAQKKTEGFAGIWNGLNGTGSFLREGAKQLEKESNRLAGILNQMREEGKRIAQENANADIAEAARNASATERSTYETPLEQKRTQLNIKRENAALDLQKASTNVEYQRKYGDEESIQDAINKEALAKENLRAADAESDSFEQSRFIDPATGKRKSTAEINRMNRAERNMRRELQKAKDAYNDDFGLISVTRGSGGEVLEGIDAAGGGRVSTKAQREGRAIQGEKDAQYRETLGAINARDGATKVLLEIAPILKRWDNGK